MSLRKASGSDRSLSTRLLQTTGFALALITASAAGVHAEIVIVQGDDGAAGDRGQSGGGIAEWVAF
jgi:hypothetical protein